MIRYDAERKTVFSPCDLKLNGSPSKCLLIFDDEIWEDFVLPNKALETFSVTNALERRNEDIFSVAIEILNRI